MNKKLLEILRCPQCQEGLISCEETYENDRVKSGTLVCNNRHRYEIKNFVPHFSKQEAGLSDIQLFSYTTSAQGTKKS